MLSSTITNRGRRFLSSRALLDLVVRCLVSSVGRLAAVVFQSHASFFKRGADRRLLEPVGLASILPQYYSPPCALHHSMCIVLVARESTKKWVGNNATRPMEAAW